MSVSRFQGIIASREGSTGKKQKPLSQKAEIRKQVVDGVSGEWDLSWVKKSLR